MAAAKSCPKCDGRLEEGFTVDKGQSDYRVAGWYAGEPNRRWWGLKIDRKQLVAITSWRCSRCGYLENYAK